MKEAEKSLRFYRNIKKEVLQEELQPMFKDEMTELKETYHVMEKNEIVSDSTNLKLSDFSKNILKKVN